MKVLPRLRRTIIAGIFGEYEFWTMAVSGNIQILNLLINTGLNYAAQNIWKQTPLHICAIKKL